jgi:hypothetical protein
MTLADRLAKALPCIHSCQSPNMDSHYDDCPASCRPAVLALVERECERVRVETIEKCELVAGQHAERIKHTSHHDGLGMGNLNAEAACLAVADQIRALKARNEKLDLDAQMALKLMHEAIAERNTLRAQLEEGRKREEG